MKSKIFLILPLLAVSMLFSCRTSKDAASSPPIVITNSDSIRIEYIETLRIDTVTVEIPLPAESSSQIVRDSTSHLETSLALSDAWINPDGTLGHSIRNKPESLKSDIPVAVKDSHSNNSAIKTKEIPVPYPVEKKVEKELSAWQKFRLNSFWVLLTTLLASLIYIFRKPLLRLMCRLKL